MAAEDEFASEIGVTAVNGLRKVFVSQVIFTWIGGKPVGFASETGEWDVGVAP